MKSDSIAQLTQVRVDWGRLSTPGDRIDFVALTLEVLLSKARHPLPAVHMTAEQARLLAAQLTQAADALAAEPAPPRH
jgi:hypothetical protein